MENKGLKKTGFLGVLYVVTRLCVWLAGPFYQAGLFDSLSMTGKMILGMALSMSSGFMLMAVIYFTIHRERWQLIMHTVGFAAVIFGYIWCIYLGISGRQLPIILGAAALVAAEIFWIIYVYRVTGKEKAVKQDEEGSAENS